MKRGGKAPPVVTVNCRRRGTVRVCRFSAIVRPEIDCGVGRPSWFQLLDATGQLVRLDFSHALDSSARSLAHLDRRRARVELGQESSFGLLDTRQQRLFGFANPGDDPLRVRAI